MMLTREEDDQLTRDADRHWPGAHVRCDRAQIFADLTRRNALRLKVKLPPLNIPAEYARAIEQAHWKSICERLGERVQSEVITELTRRLGSEPQSAGGRWAIDALTLHRLRAIYNGTRRNPATLIPP